MMRHVHFKKCPPEDTTLRSNAFVREVNMLPEKNRDPESIRFIHETISTTLSKPKPGENKTPTLEALANDVKTGKQSMLAFPPINIFSIRDPQTQEKHYYSLNNRKLFIAKKSRSPEIRTVRADWTEVMESTWKMTSTSDGLRFPNPTRNGNKEAQPTGLLAQFRLFLEKNQRENTPSETIRQQAEAQFALKCRP